MLGDATKWEGPNPSDYTIEAGSPISLHWHEWEGCPCHGTRVEHEVQIPHADLLLDDADLTAKFGGK